MKTFTFYYTNSSGILTLKAENIDDAELLLCDLVKDNYAWESDYEDEEETETETEAEITNDYPDAINLLQQYRNDGREAQYREKFEEYKHKIENFAERSELYDLNIGDVIHFMNGYNIEMITEVLGFGGEGEAYLLWDCYWFPIRIGERLIAKVNTKL